MPNCVSLRRKSDPDGAPVSFQQIDKELCAHLGVECDPKEYYGGWYTCIGMALSLGQSFEQIYLDYLKDREWQKDPKWALWIDEMLKVIDWLEKNFVSSAWCERA